MAIQSSGRSLRSGIVKWPVLLTLQLKGGRNSSAKDSLAIKQSWIVVVFGLINPIWWEDIKGEWQQCTSILRDTNVSGHHLHCKILTEKKRLIILDRSMWFDLVLLSCLEIMSVLLMSLPWMSNLTSFFFHCSVLLILYMFMCSVEWSSRLILQSWYMIRKGHNISFFRGMFSLLWKEVRRSHLFLSKNHLFILLPSLRLLFKSVNKIMLWKHYGFNWKAFNNRGGFGFCL